MAQLALFLFSAISFISFGFYYYHKQNSKKTIGGAISKAKIFWLTYTLYVYFFVSPLMFFWGLEEPLQQIAKVFSYCIYVRAILQIWLMLSVKRWSPPMGISFNLTVAAGIVYYWLITNVFHQLQSVIYLAMIIGCLLTDSIYAWLFYRLVGVQTQGSEAIWYASDKDVRFKQINILTFYGNIIHYSLLSCLLLTL